MEFKKISAPSLKELFVKELEGMILSGELKIGDKLPSERQLAEQMGVSRTIVNAGLAEMTGKGFLEIQPRVGIFVADYRRNGSLSTLVAIMNYNGGMLKRDEIRSTIEIRIVLENLMLRRVIPQISPEEIVTLEGLLAKLSHCHTAADAANCCFDFHHELCIISQNVLLPLIYGSYRILITNLWIRYCNLYGIEAMVAYDTKLLEMIRKGNVEEALKWSEEALRETLDGSQQIYY